MSADFQPVFEIKNKNIDINKENLDSQFKQKTIDEINKTMPKLLEQLNALVKVDKFSGDSNIQDLVLRANEQIKAFYETENMDTQTLKNNLTQTLGIDKKSLGDRLREAFYNSITGGKPTDKLAQNARRANEIPQ